MRSIMRVQRTPTSMRHASPIRASTKPPLKVFIANMAGACGGVQRAVIMAAEAKAPVLGKVVHNTAVVAALTLNGSPVIARDTSASDLRAQGINRVTVTAHGLMRDRIEAMQAAGIEVNDTTCPRIKHVYRIIEAAVAAGKQIFLFGDPTHIEIQATRSRAPGIQVIGCIDDIAKVDVDPTRPAIAVCQTTMTADDFATLAHGLRQRHTGLEDMDTRCQPVAETQEGVIELAQHVEAMVIIGGKDSANTGHLFDLARARCPNVHKIELPDEINVEWLRGVNSFGIGAGTSTPVEHITALTEALAQIVPREFDRDVEVTQRGRLPKIADAFLEATRTGEEP